MVSKSRRKYIYLVFTSPDQARSIIVGNVASALHALLKSAFKGTLSILLIEKYYIGEYINVEWHQSLLEHAI